MFEITVNGRVVDANPEETILSALNRVGITVPTLCDMRGLTPTGACRLCVVEIEGCDTLAPACSTIVQEGMVIATHTPKVIRARKMILELLLSNHPDDCTFCARSEDCELRRLAAEYGIRERFFRTNREVTPRLDLSCPAIVRDASKCILCGKCVRVCQEIQKVSAIGFVGRGSETEVSQVFRNSLNVSDCIHCGQCILVCPTGALTEKDSTQPVLQALSDPERFPVVQFAPAVSVTLAEEFQLKPGTDLSGVLTAALRRIGFRAVFETAAAADLTVLEEAQELKERLESGTGLPMFTSCSPAWVRYAEKFYPELLPNVSTCKSPQAMLGAVVKSIYAERKKLDPCRIYSVAVMPCTAKKFEAERPEMARGGLPDVDAVLTTRELASLLRMFGIRLADLQAERADAPFDIRSTAGKLFGGSGGVMESTLRTLYHMLAKKELKTLKIEPVRGMDGIKEMRIKLPGREIGVAVINGIGNMPDFLKRLKLRPDQYQFIEVMACPGGCVAGGGQPLLPDLDRIKLRMHALQTPDQNESLRTAHHNEAVLELYRTALGEVGGERARQLLHVPPMKQEGKP